MDTFLDIEYPFYNQEDFSDVVHEQYFNAGMEFLWNKTLHHKLPFRLESLLDHDGKFKGVEVV